MEDSEIIYIPGMARLLGKTETAVIAMVQRGVDIPRPFKIGRKNAWRRADVEAWLKAKAEGAAK